MKDKKIQEKIDSILKNIEENGLKRYDPRDLRAMNFVLKKGKIYSVLRKVLGVSEVIFPIKTRELFKIKKQIYPTTYIHLINALFIFDEIEYKEVKLRYCSYLQEYLNRYVENEDDNCYWLYPETIIFSGLRKLDTNKKQTICMHYLARFGILLDNVFEKTKSEEILKINIKTIETTLKQHKITKKDDRTVYINYYVDTDDCTLNINSEFINWLVLLPNKYYFKYDWIVEGIVRLLINEQNSNGSWDYFSKEYIKEQNISKHPIDSHHTATILYNLIDVIESGKLESKLNFELTDCCRKGYSFLINNFISKVDGKCKQLITGRKAGPVQYLEILHALISYVESNVCTTECKIEVEKLIPLVFENLLNLIERDGSTPSEFLLGIGVNYDSIRWGNGAALEAIARYMRYLRNKGN